MRQYSYYQNFNQLKSNGKYNFEYDNNGNLVKKSTINGDTVWSYEYDLLNRLVKATKDGVDVAGYIYDESGLRLKKQGKDKAVYYVFDINGNVLYEQENREYLEYVYVLGKHFARVDGNLDNLNETKKYFYHTDHLGSTVAVTDEAGQTVWASEYTPFGGKHSTDGELAHAAKFTGKDLDEDIGLYYFNARWYDQEVGRFVSKDQWVGDINIPLTLNKYSYCLSNPIVFNDPDGNEPNRSQAVTWQQARKVVMDFFGKEGPTLQGLRYTSGEATGKQVGPFGGSKGARYIYTEKHGWIDLGHFFQVGAGAQSEGLTGTMKLAAKTAGRFLIFNKLWQITKKVEDNQSGETQWSYEDGPTNAAGLTFYLDYYKDDKSLLESLDKFFEDAGATTPEKALNWEDMQQVPQKERRFEQNISLKPKKDPQPVKKEESKKVEKKEEKNDKK